MLLFLHNLLRCFHDLHDIIRVRRLGFSDDPTPLIVLPKTLLHQLHNQDIL
jgi:hypothetical protein